MDVLSGVPSAFGPIDIPLDELADPNIKISIDQVAFQIDSLPDYARAEIVAVAKSLERELLALARAKADDDVLEVRSGRFLGSIDGVVDATATGVEAEVFSTDPKAHILEYGASLPAHGIGPRRALALHFGGQFAAHVNFPGATLAPHPTIHAAFAEMEGKIYEELIDAVQANLLLGEPDDPGALRFMTPLASLIPGGQPLLSAVLEDLAAPFELAAL